MDGVLGAVDVVADSGLEGAITWILRLVGLVALLGGIGPWLFGRPNPRPPGALVLAGLVLLIVPGLLLALADLAE